MTEKTAKTCYLEPILVERYNQIKDKKPTLSELLNIAIAAYLGEVSDEVQLYLKVISFNDKIKARLDNLKRAGESSA